MPPGLVGMERLERSPRVPKTRMPASTPHPVSGWRTCDRSSVGKVPRPGGRAIGRRPTCCKKWNRPLGLPRGRWTTRGVSDDSPHVHRARRATVEGQVTPNHGRFDRVRCVMARQLPGHGSRRSPCPRTHAAGQVANHTTRCQAFRDRRLTSRRQRPRRIAAARRYIAA